MNKPLLTLLFATTLTAWPLATTARAQWSLEGSLFQNNSYYRGYVNPFDNTMTRTRMNFPMRTYPMMSPGFGGGRDSQPPSVYGARVIKRGRATIKFKTRPFPIGQYMSRDWSGGGDAQLRKRYYAEYLAQTALWRQEAQARGAQFGDYAQMHALAFVTCVEAYAGKRISNAGFQYKAARDRRLYLTSAAFQGYDATRKQESYESAMLHASYSLYLRRNGNIEKARETAAAWLNKEWDTDHKGVPDAQDAVNSLARFATASSARPTMRRIAPAQKPVSMTTPSRAATPPRAATPSLSLAQAVQITQFSPVSDSLLPAMLSANAQSSERERVRQTVARLLAAGNGKMRELFTVPSGKRSVSDAMTYAVITFYTASKTTSGSLAEVGFTSKNLAALNRQFTMMLARNPEFQAHNARQKQQMYESFVLMATFVGAMSGQAQKTGDAEMRAHSRALASQSLRNLVGVAPERVRLTDAGLQLDGQNP